MKTIVFLLFVSFFISNSTFCQNILQLKNGDKINGKLEEYKNDTVTFRLSGNLLKFNTSSVASITFENVLSSANQNESTATKESKTEIEGQILGVITYRNEKGGISPDLGALVYITDSTTRDDINWPLLDSSMNINGIIAGHYRQEYKLNRLAVKDITSRATKDVSNFLYSQNTIKTVVDLTGNYSVKVNPGIYYILIQSSQIDRMNYKIQRVFRKITVKEGEDKRFNFSF